jgi:hypothetical protein
MSNNVIQREGMKGNNDQSPPRGGRGKKKKRDPDIQIRDISFIWRNL